MPVFGAWPVARKALEALRDGTEPPYEVVIVDDGSSEEVRAALREEVRGARLLLNERNLGFGPSNNRGAAVCRAPFLALLNSDAFVRAGWLPPLLAAAEDPLVGAVSPRVLNSDGTLQEAGCVVFDNAHTWFHGYGADADDPAYGFPRDVDYASAACLLVRRRAFETLGGFDAAYAPAYYEDVELCWALRDRGWRCVYEPRSVVTHVRNASTDPDLSSRAWQKSVTEFRRRHATGIRSRPSWVPPEDPLWRARSAAGRDATVSTNAVVAPGPSALEGGRSESLVKALSARRPHVRTTLLSDRPEARSLARLGVEVAPLEAATPWLEGRPFHYDVAFVDGSTSRQVREAVARTQPQAHLVVDLALASGTTWPPPALDVGSLAPAGSVVLVDGADADPLGRFFPGRTVVPVPPAPGREDWLDALLAGLGIGPAPDA